jgi:hypothetical protein
MAIEANRGAAGPSPFSRPPQPKPAPTPGNGHGAPSAAPSHSTPDRVAGPTMAGEEHETLEGQRRRGGQWFYWIAALSSINCVLALMGQEWHFILGLGTTQLVQAVAKESGGAGTTAGLVSLVVIGLFAFFGQRAVHGYCWAFVAGMVVYGLDGLIFLLIQDWVGVGFHAFAIVMILRGYQAARQLPAPTD